MKDYSLYLDHRALALQHVHTGEYLSEIVTTHGVYHSKLSPTTLLNRACLRNHSSMKGREEAVRKVFGFVQKPPFLISEDVGVFPIMSSEHPECTWIFSHFFNMEVLGKKRTKLIFINGTEIIVPVSHDVVIKQKTKLHTLLSHSYQLKQAYFADYPHSFVMERSDTTYSTSSSKKKRKR